jgi:hypothetical protein
MTFHFLASGSVSVTMEGYTNDLLELANIPGIVKTLAAENLFEIRDAPLLSAE